MSQFIRSGRPQHLNHTTAAGGDPQEWSITVGITNQLVINNVHATEPLEVFLTAAAAALGAGAGFTIQPGFGHAFDVEVRRFWTLTTNAGSFQAVAIGRA